MEKRYIADLVANEAKRYANAHKDTTVEISLPNGRGWPPVRVTLNGMDFDFYLSITPFNADEITSVIDNKWRLYEASSEALHMPLTKGFTKDGADLNEIFRDIMSDIENEAHPYTFPIVVKPSRGSKSVNVCICHDENELQKGLEIVAGDQGLGSHIVVQQYIGPASEYRAVFFKNELMYIYEKNANHVAPDEDVRLGKDANPSYWEGAEAGIVENADLVERVKEFGNHVHTNHGATYFAFDIRVDEYGQPWVLECNSSPLGLERVLETFDNGRAILEKLGALMVAHMVHLTEQASPVFEMPLRPELEAS